MSKTAKQFLGDLGTMKGDVEVAIFKQLRARGVNKANFGGTIIEVGTNTHGARTVFVNNVSAAECSLESLVDILDRMEQEREQQAV